MTALDRHRAHILRIAAKYGASNVRVAGDEVGPDAGFEFIVDMDADRSLFDLVDLSHELEELLGLPVEVLTAASLNPRLLANALAHARVL
jgi:predicted nucleotidyltransferase